MFPIAWITLRRITEKAVLIQFGILALVLIYLGLGAGERQGVDQAGLMVTLLFLTAFTFFWTTIEVPREVSRGEVQVYLSKPLSRFRYLLGKFMGMTALILAGEVLLLAVFAACMFVREPRPTVWFLFTATRTALFLILFNALAIAASIILGEIPGMIFIGIVLFGGLLIFALPLLAWASFDRATSSSLTAAYYVLPNLMHYRWLPTNGGLLPYLGALLLYTAGWTTLFLAASHAVLQRRDLS